MTRDEQEMALWREAYTLAISQGASYGDADEAATTAAESFRKRYPVEPDAPEPTAPGLTWYDEPPFAKDGELRPCWIAGKPFPCAVYWSGHEWTVYVAGDFYPQQLAGRRVLPIIKPQEPTT